MKRIAIWHILLALMLISAVSLSLPAVPVQAASYPLSASDARIKAALDFLRNSESAHPTLWGGGEKNCYAIVAIDACGADPHDFKNSEGKSMVDIIRGQVGTYCRPQASAALAHEYYLLAISAARENPWNFGGVNVAGQLLDLFNGQQFGQTGIVNDDFWAIISLVGAGVNPSLPAIQTTRQFIINHQNADGSWGSSIAGGGMSAGGDPCDTANAITALIAAGESPSSTVIQNALDYIKRLQKEDGGFPYVPEVSVSDVATDARVMAAIRACGGNPTSARWTVNGNSPFSHALTLQNDDGGFAWTAGGSTDAWMTTYVMPALVGKYWPTRVLSETPSVVSVSPAQGAVVKTARPQISASYTDTAAGVDSVVLKVDGADVTSRASVSGSAVSYTPPTDLGQGSHTAQLTLSDRAGKTASRTWTFTVDTEAGETPSPGDTAPPQVDSVSPADGVAVASLRPQISASYSDALSGIDTSRAVLRVNGLDVTAEAVVGVSGITYQPAADLAAGTVEARLSLWDNAGNVIHHSWGFTVGAEDREGGNGDGADDGANHDADPGDVTDAYTSSLSLVDKKEGSGALSDDVSLQSQDKLKLLKVRRGTIVLGGDGLAVDSITMESQDSAPDVAGGYCRIGTACYLGPEGTVFSEPATLTFYYKQSSTPDSIRWDTNGDGNVDILDKDVTVTPEDFQIAYYDNATAGWVFLESAVDKANRAVTAEVARCSLLALVAPAAGPLVVKNIVISPAAVGLGEDVTITVTVENPGEYRGTYLVPLYIDGFYGDSLEAVVDPGEHDISFTHSEPYAGDHEAKVMGVTAAFTVSQAAERSANWWDSVDVVFYLYIVIGALCIVIIAGAIILAMMLRGRAR